MEDHVPCPAQPSGTDSTGLTSSAKAGSVQNAKATSCEGNTKTSFAQPQEHHRLSPGVRIAQPLKISSSTAQGERMAQGWVPGPVHGQSATAGRGSRDGPRHTQSGQEVEQGHSKERGHGQLSPQPPRSGPRTLSSVQSNTSPYPKPRTS